MKQHETLDTQDIQGLVVRGYKTFAEARFLFLEVLEPELARSYLRDLCARVNTAHGSHESFALQVAFTAGGLARLEVPDSARKTFSREFLEGMDDEVRATSLGDDPKTWEWGRTADGNVHMLVILYALDKPTAERHLVTELAAITAGGFRVTRQKATTTLPNNKEHFGWRDGLSLPNFECTPGRRKNQGSSWTSPLRAGEFVLGYLNEYDCYGESPTAELADDPAGHLPPMADGARKNLGRNGTYLVFRELTQHVKELWDYLATNSREPGDDPAARAIALGTKMVGRWPSGAPLIMSPDRDDPRVATDNEFTYSSDPVGLACPLGSHIRRASPRDALAADHTSAESVTMVRKHQMIRRGRAFGPPSSPTMDPREIFAARETLDREKRGLHFICLVGNLSRQFEFVQRNWIQSANFGGLFKDADPLTGTRRASPDDNANDEHTVPAKPLRRKYKQLPQFTTLVGGAYFFLPGIAALRFIARQP